VLRILVDRRRSLGDEHTRQMSQVHPLLLELTQAVRRRTCPRPRPRRCSPLSDPATSQERPVAASPRNLSLTSSGSISARRPPTRSSTRWSPRPAPACWT
jgi:hypothetical protein